MDDKLKIIFEDFEGKLIGNSFMKLHVCKTLEQMPKEIVDFVTKNCWFVSSFEDAWAFAFTGNDLKDQHLIFLSEELLRQHEQQIHFSIAHEIGHVVNHHRNSTLIKQSSTEIQNQEYEADEFAKKYVH